MTTIAYTDGACQGNPGPGGWAWAVPGGRFASGAEGHSTNQRMEITAAYEAIRSIDGPLRVVSDSTYVVNCFRDRWWEGWMKKGWVNSQRKPVANRDLWEPLIEAVRADPQRVRFEWVKGHSDDPMNDLVDRLAVEASRTQQPRSGDEPPTELGPPDVVGRGGAGERASDPLVPDGHGLVVVGPRPPAIGGYGDNPTAAGIRRRLAEIIDAKAALQPDLLVLTGLGLGVEQLAAEAAIDAGVPYVVVLPFPDQDKVWPAESRVRYRQLLEAAKAEILLQASVPGTKQQAGAALARRDAWLARHASEAVAVWDGKDANLGRLVRSLQDHLGEPDVWVLDPAS
jgi:ribonuclease HI/uncharacterized phage-like protein YoqJ